MLTFRIVLGTGMVISVGDPWLDPNGELAKDREGKDLGLFVGGIFFQPETTESVGGGGSDEPEQPAAAAPAAAGNGTPPEEEEEEDEDDGEVQSTPACYLAFAKPLPNSPLANSPMATVRRVFLSGNVLFADEEWSAQMANAFVEEEIRAAMMRNKEAILAARAAAAAAAQAAPAG